MVQRRRGFRRRLGFFRRHRRLRLGLEFCLWGRRRVFLWRLCPFGRVGLRFQPLADIVADDAPVGTASRGELRQIDVMFFGELPGQRRHADDGHIVGIKIVKVKPTGFFFRFTDRWSFRCLWLFRFCLDFRRSRCFCFFCFFFYFCFVDTFRLYIRLCLWQGFSRCFRFRFGLACRFRLCRLRLISLRVAVICRRF